MMTAGLLLAFLQIAALLLLASLVLGLLRVLRGPTLEDRLTAVLLLGSGGVAFLLLLAQIAALPALVDAALLLALLAAVVTVALTRREVSDD